MDRDSVRLQIQGAVKSIAQLPDGRKPLRWDDRGQSAKKTPMEIEVETIDEDALIKLSGRVDMSTSPDLRKSALALYTKRQCKEVTIDFAGVSYIDTSGLATLVEILLSAKQRGARLILSGLNEKVRYVLEVNGLTPFFKIEGSAREKLSA